MMISVQSTIQRLRHRLRRWQQEPRLQQWLRAGGFFLAGAVLSAAALGNVAQPLALGFLLSCSGWPGVLVCAGGICGSFLFWGSAGVPCALWLLLGLPGALLLGKFARGGRLLLPALAVAVVSVTGLYFQWRWDSGVSVPMQLLRMAVAGAGTWVFARAQQQAPLETFLSKGLWVLALAQIAPVPWLGLGYIAAGYMALQQELPGAVLGGMALDLAGITPLPMTAVTGMAFFLRLLPLQKKWLTALGPAAMGGLVMALWELWDLQPLPGLLLGGLLGVLLPGQPLASGHKGETGLAQVRLEMAAGVMNQMQQLLLEAPLGEIDQEAVLERAVQRCCSSCPCRKSCPEKERALAMPTRLLHQPLLDGRDLPILCRRENRLLQELRRAQEQLRSLRADRRSQQEYRGALVQQYQFLGEFLQDLSDLLSRRGNTPRQRYRPEVSLAVNRLDTDSGDRCLRFAGVGCKYYVLLCDGMGTGLGAAQEGREAAAMLKRLLCAGYPAEYALRSLNSLCALRGMAGIVTADLAELQLDTGKVLLYKWGAPASWLLQHTAVERIGTAGPPPGLSVTESRETVDRLSLRRGEILVLCSDGISGEDAFRRDSLCGLPFGELAARILEAGNREQTDDATVAVVRLRPELLPP